MRKIKMATINLGTLVGKTSEIANMQKRRKFDICCVQETRYKGQGAMFAWKEKRF